MSSCNTAIKITPYEIIDVTKHTDLEWSFRIRSDMAIQYGQYIDLVLPMYGEVPIAISDFGNGYLEIMGSKHGCTMEALFEKKIGDQVWLRKPKGLGYPLSKFNDKHLVVIAQGTGVGAVKGLISHYCREPYLLKHMDIILGFHNDKEALFKDEMRAWNNCVNLIATTDIPSEDEFFESGLVTEYLDTVDIREKKDLRVVIVGSPVVIRSVGQIFTELGLTKQQIWVCYERRVSSGNCQCEHCRVTRPFCCQYGPVFRYDKALTMVR